MDPANSSADINKRTEKEMLWNFFFFIIIKPFFRHFLNVFFFFLGF